MRLVQVSKEKAVALDFSAVPTFCEPLSPETPKRPCEEDGLFRCRDRVCLRELCGSQGHATAVGTWGRRNYPKDSVYLYPCRRFHAFQTFIIICHIQSGCIQNGITYKYQPMELHQRPSHCRAIAKSSCMTQHRSCWNMAHHPWFAVEGERILRAKLFGFSSHAGTLTYSWISLQNLNFLRLTSKNSHCMSST